MTTKSIILCDMDETLVDLMSPIIERTNSKFNIDLDISDFKTYDIFDSLDKEISEYIVEEEFHRKDLYEHVDWIPGAEQAIRRINDLSNLFIVSRPLEGHIESKYSWLLKQGFKEQQIILTKEKSLIKGDVLIDDYYDNVEKFDNDTILFAKPWNRSFAHPKRAKDWNQVLEFLTTGGYI